MFKLGALIKFIPRPVTIGFTAGVAVIIFSGQMTNFLGLTDIEKHEDFLSNMREIVTHISTISLYSVITAGICLAVILWTPRFLPKIPGSIVALLVSSVIAATGAIARTATNIKNGAISPMSGIIHSVTVLFVLILFAPYASHIPLASMAPILMLVA